MDDLIRREAAIDAIEHAKTARSQDGEIYVAKLNAEMNIQILPSAEPNLQPTCNQLATDTISRQAAIDAIKYAELGCELEAIEALPSAEREKGKWIRHEEIKNVYGGLCIECPKCGEKYVVRHIEDEKFCRNCGAEMRGEEDG